MIGARLAAMPRYRRLAVLLALLLVLDFSLGEGCDCEPSDFGSRSVSTR